MAEQENIQKVQAAYAAFQRGDIPALLQSFTEDVEWDTPGSSEIIPYAGKKRGHDEVRQFFAALGKAEEITHFEPQEFIAQGDKVVVVGNYKGRVHATNRQYDIDWLHVFTVRGDKLSSFREYLDTAALSDAHRSAATQAA